MFKIVYIAILTIFIAGCSIDGKEMRDGINECTENDLGFLIKYNGISINVPTSVVCCLENTNYRKCNFSELNISK